MAHRARRVRVLRVIGLAALAWPLACGSEKLGPDKDAGPGQVVGGRGGAVDNTGGTAGGAGHAGGAADQAGGVSGSGGSAGAAGVPGVQGSITEWSIPFADSQPFQIAASGTTVFYVNNDAQQMLGRLDTQSGTVTEWPLSHPATSPGDIQIRPSDGAVFFTSGTTGELGQFDPQSQSLQTWPLPLDVPTGNTPGPWSIAFDASDRVVFSAYDAKGPLIGRLDTTSGHLDVWSSPAGGPVRVALAPNGTVVFPSMGPSFEVVRFDPTTGVFTAWALVDQPLWGAVVDGSGDCFFLQQTSDFQGLARFAPDTGRLTTWANADLFQSDTLDLLSGHTFFASSSPIALEALDPTVPGTDTVLSVTDTETVLPRTSVATPTMATLAGRQGSAQVTHGTTQRQTAGPFSTWSLPDDPRMLVTVPGAVYFTGGTQPLVGRMTVGTL
jgi:streptogramin lyase